MIVKKPTVKRIQFDDVLKHLTYCARVCTDTQAKTEDTDCAAFVEKLIKAGHMSCLEHAAVDISDKMIPLELLKDNEPSFGLVMSRAVLGSLRFRDLYEGTEAYRDITKWNELPRSPGLITFEVECSRVTSQQFERHRNLSFLERSMRYVTFKSVEDFEVVLPESVDDDSTRHSIECAIMDYRRLKDNKLSSDEARYVLPLCTATKLIVSGDLTWWLNFLELRYNKAASKEIITVARQIYEQAPWDLHEYVCNTPELEEQFDDADKCIVSGS